MRMRMIAMAAAVAAVGIILQGSVAAAAATKHVVGGTSGWTIPPNASFYSDWSSNSQTFRVGDTLEFNFTTGIHNVMPVGKAGYDGCSTQGTVGATLTTGPASVTLTSPGAHYYICGVPTHCSLGQKLAVNVSAAAASGPAPSPSPSPSQSPSGPPASPPGGPAPEAPTPPSAPAPASPAGAAAPPPGGSSAAAPPSGSAVRLLALLAAAAAAAAAY